MLIKSRMSLIIWQIELGHPELFALEFGIIAESDFVYTPASTNIDQSAPNLVKMYMTIRSRISFNMYVIRPELSELSNLELEKNFHIWLCLHSSICKYWPIRTKLGHNIYAHKVSDEFDYLTNRTRTSWVICPWIWNNCWIWLCLHSSIYKYWPISTKLGQNVYDHRISDEFDYGCNQTRTLRVVYPWIRKLSIFDFVYTPASANIDQSVPNLVTVYMPIKSRMRLISGQIEPENSELFALEFGKIAESDFVNTLASTNINHWAPNLVKMYVTIRFGWVRLWI